MIEFVISEHEKLLLKIVEDAKEAIGLDGVPDSATLRSALAVEEYASERALACMIAGLRSQGLEIDQRTLIGAYVEGKQIVPSAGFQRPLMRGEVFEI